MNLNDWHSSEQRRKTAALESPFEKFLRLFTVCRPPVPCSLTIYLHSNFD